ncbi:imidazole glycerol phosphate synthase subunit HisH [Patescibacteria group bacterium]|nr:imidazole glycerol phosphate synthase subunit HisH [Patescibacteria group bacterium]
MIALIDYKAGNIGSVKNALERLRFDWVVASRPEEILSAEGVIFPGQGRAGAAMKELKKRGVAAIISKIKKPFLGICLGMQLLGRYSEEDKTKCIGIFKGKCRKFPPTFKIPHIGWNKVELNQGSSLTAGIPDGSYFYFAHSYYVDAAEVKIIGKTSYGFDFPSIMQKDNFFAVQFHPEKSGEAGMKLLNNFCKLCS